MSAVSHAAWFDASRASVSFVPAPTARVPPARRVADVSHLGAVDQVLKELRHPLTELSRRARRLGPDEGATILLLTGCRRNVGCTTVALALAAAAACDGAVLALDGDLTSPGLSRMAFTRPQSGWDESLRGLSEVETALTSADPQGELSLLALSGPVPSSDDVVGDPRLPDWLAGLRRDYSLIVVDGGSVWESGAGWSASADCALVVCDSGRNLADEWSKAWDRLEEGGTQVLGIVETFI